jgi:hypothetical protein
MSFCARTWLLGLLALVLGSNQLHADVKTKAAQEVAEAVMARFGARAARSLPALAQRIESFAAKYGEEALLAVRRVGPEAFALVEQAGANGPRAVRLLAQYGEEGAACVLRRPRAMQQFLRYGEEAAAVLCRHPGIAGGLIEKGGASAVNALAKVTPQGARRMAMVLEGELQTAGKTELLGVVGKYGQKACDFIWENKGALAVGATLTAFVTNPEPFLNGAVKLTGTVTEQAANAVAKPLAEGVAKGTNWTVVILVALLLGGGLLAFRLGLFRWLATPIDAPAKAATVAGGGAIQAVPKGGGDGPSANLA